MKDNPGRRGAIDAAQRGHIIQRVLVDGWSPARAAAAFEVEERVVAAWVARYRRHGMASLRQGESEAERLPWRFFGVLRGGALRAWAGLRRACGRREVASCVVLRRTKDDGRGWR